MSQGPVAGVILSPWGLVGVMAPTNVQSDSAGAWALVSRQHGVVTRSQLLEQGFSSDGIKHRIAKGRLHPLWRGVYAVGRPEVSRHGRWMAAVLSCGPTALLSHRGAAALWGLLPATPALDVTIPSGLRRRRLGIRVHRRSWLVSQNRRAVAGIPLTDPVSTLIDLATCVSDWQLERAVNEADRLDLIDPETLRAAAAALARRPGLARLLALLDPRRIDRLGT